MTNRLQLMLLKYDDEVRHLLGRHPEAAGSSVLPETAGPVQAAAGPHLRFMVLGFAVTDRDSAANDFALTPKALLAALAREVEAALAETDGLEDQTLIPTSLDRLLDRVAEASIGAVVQRGMTISADLRPLTFAGWTIDPASRQLHDPAGAMVALTAAEFALLMALARHPRQTLSRQRLHELAFGRSSASLDRGVDILISRLRRRLGTAWPSPTAGSRALIRTVRGSGYLFDTDVQEILA